MTTTATPLTMAQIREQTRELLGTFFFDQSFTPDQVTDAINWACDELARTLGMTYVPFTKCYFQAPDLRRPLIPEASVKIVQAIIQQDTGQTVLPNGASTTEVFAGIDTSIYGHFCDLIASDGTAQVFMARHNGAADSILPKGWIIAKMNRDGSGLQLVAGVLGTNAAWAYPPTSDSAYTTAVDGAAGVSTVIAPTSMAVRPDGNAIAWLEGDTNRLRVAELISGVWTTRTVAGAYNTYMVDGTGASAGFALGLAPNGDTNYGSYGQRYYSWRSGMVWLDNNTLLITETPAGYYHDPLAKCPSSRLLSVNMTTGQVQTLATDPLTTVMHDQYHIVGGWSFPTLLPIGQDIDGCRLILNRMDYGVDAVPPHNLFPDLERMGNNWPSMAILQGVQGAIAPSATIVTLASSGGIKGQPGTQPFPQYLTGIAVDVNPKGTILSAPTFSATAAFPSERLVVQPDFSEAYVRYPMPYDETMAFQALAAGPATSFPDHMVVTTNGVFGYPVVTADGPGPEYLQRVNHWAWIGGELLVVVGGSILSCGGA